MSRICTYKTERNLQIFGWCLQFKQSCPWATLSYFCLQNKAGKINAMRRVVLRKMFHKSSALSIHLKKWRSPFANWIHYICRQKTTTSLWNLDRKRESEKKGIRGHRLIMHSITHRGGECEKRAGGGGAAPLHILYMSQVKCKRYDNMRNTLTFQLCLKENFYLQRSRSGG